MSLDLDLDFDLNDYMEVELNREEVEALDDGALISVSYTVLGGRICNYIGRVNKEDIRRGGVTTVEYISEVGFDYLDRGDGILRNNHNGEMYAKICHLVHLTNED